MLRISLFCALLITAWLVVLVSGQRGVCYRQSVRYQTITYTRSNSRNYEVLCTWGWGRKCTRVHTWTTYHTRSVARYSQVFGCCSGYVLNNGVCRRTVIGLERSQYEVSENTNTVEVCARVKETTAIYGGINMEIATTSHGGEARSPSDFSRSSVTIRFTQTATRHCLTIPITYDYEQENAESFTVTLRGLNIPNYVHFGQSAATVTIRNVYRVRFGFHPVSYAVNEHAGNVSVCAQVYAVAGTVQDAEVIFRTSSNGARSPGDFTATSVRATFTNSTRQQCVSIPIVHDHLHEGPESFGVHLTSIVPHVTLDPANAIVEIVNIQRLTIGFEQTELQVLESSGNFSACARIVQPSDSDSLPSNATYIVATRTREGVGAVAPDDFIHVSGLFHLSSSTRRQCLTITVRDDTVYERVETFEIILFRTSGLPAYVTLSPNRAAVRIVHSHRMTIGFEHINLPVSEQAGHVSACVRVLEPTGPDDSIVNTHYTVGVATSFVSDHGAGPHDITITATTVTLTSESRRQCVNISITPDCIHEPFEIFEVHLSRITLPPYVQLSPDITSVTIYDGACAEP